MVKCKVSTCFAGLVTYFRFTIRTFKLEANTTFFLLSQGGWSTEKFGRKAERDDEKTEVKSWSSIRFFFLLPATT